MEHRLHPRVRAQLRPRGRLRYRVRRSAPRAGYRNASGPYEPCSAGAIRARAAPRARSHAYCGTDNDHYGGYTEPSWANGGSKPIVFPWLALQTGFRFKPTKQFVARLDSGFGTSGFFFGLGADYGL